MRAISFCFRCITKLLLGNVSGSNSKALAYLPLGHAPPPFGPSTENVAIKNLTHCRHRSQGGITEEAKRKRLICP